MSRAAGLRVRSRLPLATASHSAASEPRARRRACPRRCADPSGVHGRSRLSHRPGRRASAGTRTAGLAGARRGASGRGHVRSGGWGRDGRDLIGRTLPVRGAGVPRPGGRRRPQGGSARLPPSEVCGGSAVRRPRARAARGSATVPSCPVRGEGVRRHRGRPSQLVRSVGFPVVPPEALLQHVPRGAVGWVDGRLRCAPLGAHHRRGVRAVPCPAGPAQHRRPAGACSSGPAGAEPSGPRFRLAPVRGLPARRRAVAGP